eukprot:3172334-Rhodomonas_salina.1
MTKSAAEIGTLLKAAKSNPLYKRTAELFVGSDIDYDAGTTSWLKGRVRVGGPLPTYDNITHNVSSDPPCRCTTCLPRHRTVCAGLSDLTDCGMDREQEEEQLEKYAEEYKYPGSFGSPTPDGWIVKIQDAIAAAEKENSDIK